MYGLLSSLPFTKSRHPRSINFSLLFTAAQNDIDDYLNRQTKRRLTELLAPHLVEINAQ